MSKYLPKFSYGMYTSGKTITTKVELTEALTTFSSGKVYKIAPSSAEYSIELDTINAVNKNIAYTDNEARYGYCVACAGAVSKRREGFTG